MNNKRGFAPLCNKKGMALVVALLTSFILLALVASLFWVIASTSRQSEYAKNSAIALNLAEAGTADAIYRLNYCTGTDLYPFAGSLNPFGTSLLVDLSTDHDILTSSLFSTPFIIGTGSGIKGTFLENGGTYYVGIQDNTYSDTLVAVGIYKGVRRILTAPLRGNNDPTQPRHPTTPPIPPVTQGISEAFNKHVIYATTVVYNTGTVNGNITSTNDILTVITTNTGVTKTKVSSINNTSFPVLTSLATLPVPSWTHIYNDGDCMSHIGSTFVTEGYGGYLGGNYTVTNLSVNQNLYFQNGTTTGTPTVNISALATINSSIGTTGNLTLTSGTKTIGTGVVFQPSGTITVSGDTTINGDLIVKGVPLTLNNSNIRVNGAVLCDNAITLSNNTLNIIASTSNKEAAVLMDSTTGDTITISASPVITLGSNQKAAVIAYSSTGAVGVSVNANLTPTMNSSQSNIIAYAGSNTANIKIGNSAAANVNGLVYAYSGDAVNVGNITLGGFAGNINSTLVADGTVTLSGGINLILSYDIPAFTGASLGSDIFSGFSGGRRTYVPTWQGWGLR